MNTVPGSLRLNPYQTLVRQWEAIHPHNAAQVMLVSGLADVEACEFAWQAMLREVGLGRVSTDGVCYWHEVWDGEPSPPLVDAPATTLEAHLTTELNRAFPRGAVLPYRPFVLQQADGYHLGIVYQQWVADSVSIRLLLREWFLRIHEPQKARRKLFTLIGGARAQGPRLGSSPARLLRLGLEAYRWLQQTRRLQQPADCSAQFPGLPANPGPRSPGLHVSLRTYSLPDSQINGLLTYARVEGVTLNDLLLAVFARSLHEVCPPSDPSRGDLALATSVDLRPYTPADLSEAFGSLLTYPVILCPADKLTDFRRLLLHIGRQNHALKDFRELALRMALMRFLAWRTQRLHGPAAFEFYRRRAPILGAVTNVNMNRSWAVGSHPHPIHAYYRFSPPAPAVPVVLSATTLGNTHNFTLTWRPSLLPDERVSLLLHHLTTTLASLTA